MFVSAIVLAAGKGVRFSRPKPGKSRLFKLLVKLNAKPLVVHSLATLNNHRLIGEIVVVANVLNSPQIIQNLRRYRISKVKDVVLGGKERKDSVYRGLKAVSPQADLVLIHDGARPFLDSKILSQVITVAKENGAAILGVPVKATIKQVTPSATLRAGKSQSHKVTDEFVVDKTIDRSSLWEIQTPQVFRKDLIFKAYEKFQDLEATDDAMLVEKLGVQVSVVLGSYSNIKITTPEDLVIAEAIAKRC